MANRRKFLKNSLAGSVLFPSLELDNLAKYNLDFVDKRSDQDDEEYWQMVRKQFPLKEGQTYFNNGTMGPTSGYALNKMINHLQHYSIHAAEIDYKNGSGPELLSGYFKYEELRSKSGKSSMLILRRFRLPKMQPLG